MGMLVIGVFPGGEGRVKVPDIGIEQEGKDEDR
jgi:hypothetical protein